MLDNLFEEELRQDKKIQTIMFTSLRKIYILSYTYSGSAIIVIIFYYTPVFIFIIREFIRDFRLTTNYTLPSGFKIYPWTIPDNLKFYHLMYETITSIFCGITSCAIESVFGLYVYQSVSILNAMSFRLMYPLPTESYSNVLKTCIAKHQKLLQSRNTLERIFGPIVFWHIVTNAIILCGLMYEASTIKIVDSKEFATFMTYIITKMFQCFMYAWHGTLISNAGESFRTGIYFGKWTDSNLDRHVRTNIILMMMQKPMTIYAFVSSINVVMFTNLVNTTMSYFFLMQSIGDK
ncbi:odorant receptor 13a-like [Cardiocondyla obscurior]|uniref:odorant receptor 13a-like n=1 Tax=Cardiocondyla obscurior TaxID=286306 RepID=UPI003965657B